MGSFDEILNSKKIYKKELILREYQDISVFLSEFLDYVYNRINVRNYFNEVEIANIKKYIDKFISFSDTLFYKMKLIYDRSLQLYRCCGRENSRNLKFLINYFNDILNFNNCDLNKTIYERNEFEKFLDMIVFKNNDIRIFDIISKSEKLYMFKYNDGELFINKIFRYYKYSIDNSVFECSEYYGRIIFELLKKDKDKIEYVVSKLREYSKDKNPKKNNLITSLIDRLMLLKTPVLTKDEKERYLMRIKSNYGINDYDGLNLELTSHARINQVIDLRKRNIITIDHSYKSAYDDAISIEKTEYGYLFSIYITDVASFIDMDSLLYKFAKHQCESIYCDLKNNLFFPMLPLDMTRDFFSLNKGQDKYVIAYDFKFSDSFELISKESNNAIIRINNNYTFDSIENIDDDNYEMIYMLMKITEVLRGQINENYHIQKEKNNMHGVETGVGSKIISTSTIYLNSTVAQDFKEFKLPFIYKVHDNEVTCESDKIRKLFRSVGLSKYSEIPLGHPVVNNMAYAQITNPIRSYVSLLNQHFYEYFMLDLRMISERRMYIDYWNAYLPKLVVEINNRIEKNKEFVSVIEELDNKQLTKKKKVL